MLLPVVASVTGQHVTLYLVAFLSCRVVAVGVREVDVTGCDLHHLFDVPTTFSNHMGVFCVGHVHFQSHFVYLGFHINPGVSHLHPCLHILVGAGTMQGILLTLNQIYHFEVEMKACIHEYFSDSLHLGF